MMHVAAAVAASLSISTADQTPAISPADRTMLVEAHRLIESVGDRIWPGWSEVPRPVLLITADAEFAVGFPDCPEGFESIGELTGTDLTVAWRERTFERPLQASFPFMGHPAVIIGDAEELGFSPAQWVLTCTHEMFHVLQMHRGEFEKVASLGIGPKDDASWQLDFPFPYDDEATMQLMHLRVYPLYLAATGHDAAYNVGVAAEADELLRERLLAQSGDDRAYDYLRFQELKEGVARYTEREICRLAAESGDPPAPDFRELAGDDAYADHWAESVKDQLMVSKHVGRTARSRAAFYYSGLAAACALDVVSPEWRERYFDRQVWLDGLLWPH